MPPSMPPRVGDGSPVLSTATRTRIGLAAWISAGLLAGAYLVYLLAREIGAEAALPNPRQVLPAAAVAVAWFVVPLYAAARSWHYFFPPGGEPPAGRLTGLAWIGLSVNWLLPTALVGGELVRLRLAMRRDADTATLAASLVADKTVQAATQLLFTLLGLLLLAAATGRLGGGAVEAGGLALFAGGLYVFYRLQRSGLFARIAAPLARPLRAGARLAAGAGRVDAALARLYERRGRWWRAVAWRSAFRLLMAGEVALAFWWLGEPVAVVAVLVLESLAQASRVAAIVIPAALGAQEAVIVAAGLVLGLPAEALIAVAAVKRLRELVVGGAGLAAWQIREGKLLLQRGG